MPAQSENAVSLCEVCIWALSWGLSVFPSVLLTYCRVTPCSRLSHLDHPTLMLTEDPRQGSWHLQSMLVGVGGTSQVAQSGRTSVPLHRGLCLVPTERPLKVAAGGQLEADVEAAMPFSPWPWIVVTCRYFYHTLSVSPEAVLGRCEGDYKQGMETGGCGPLGVILEANYCNDGVLLMVDL